jgi:hypothetical protein
MENQNFIDIIGYEGLYQINKNGEILNIQRNKLLKGYVNNRYGKDGYRMVMLCKDGNKINHTLHKLLAIHFIPNPNNLPQIDHIDQNKLNNNLENLRWVSHQTNMRNINKTINRNGGIYIKRITENGEYYEARFQIEYRKTKTKCSYNKKKLEEWLEECKNEYKRENVYV